MERPELQFVLLFSIATAVAIATRRLRLPYTVALVLVGLALGALPLPSRPTLSRDLLFAAVLPGPPLRGGRAPTRRVSRRPPSDPPGGYGIGTKSVLEYADMSNNYTMNVPTANARADLARLSRASHGGLVDASDAARALGIPPDAAVTRLARLKRRGWLQSVRRGLFLVVPLEADPSRPMTIEDPWTLAVQLFSPSYVGGWSAAEHWGLTEQIFRSIFVVSAAHVRRSRSVLLGVEFRVVKVPSRRIDGATTVWRGRERIMVSDRELTIADALLAPDWVGGFRHLVQIFRTYHDSKEWNPARLAARLNHLGKGAGFKRLGWLLERAFPGETDLVSLCFRRRSAGLIALAPAVRAIGRINKRWGLRINVEVDDR